MRNCTCTTPAELGSCRKHCSNAPAKTESWQRGQERSHAARVDRLRERIKQAAVANPDDPLPGILQGMLDLIADTKR